MTNGLDPLDDIKDISELFTPDVLAQQRKIREKLAIMRRNVERMRRAGMDVSQFEEPLKEQEKRLEQLEQLARLP